MKRSIAVIGLMILGAANAGAADIQGKWGIGAGIIGRGTGELSLIRGHSERTAWLLEVRLNGSNRDERRESSTLAIPPYNFNTLSIAAGPGLRRFTRPNAEFSPYFDITLLTSYERRHSSGSGNSSDFGAIAGLDLGLEYFTRWHFSVAAHTPLADLTWRRIRSSYAPYYESRITDISANIGLSPALFVRGYF